MKESIMSNIYTVEATYTGGLNQAHDQRLLDLAQQAGASHVSSEYDHATMVRSHQWVVDTESRVELLETFLLLGSSAPDLHVSTVPNEASA